MAGLFSKLVGRPKAPPVTPPAPSHRASAPVPTQGLTPGLFDTFKADHDRCDALWAAVEDADEAEVAQAFAAFDTAVRRHLAMEEEVLFPAFEDSAGMQGCGPTAVMRAEHQQMRGLLDAMGRAAESGDVDGVLDQGDTLLMLTQQHNIKEEQVLYPMAEGQLAPSWHELEARLGRY